MTIILSARLKERQIGVGLAVLGLHLLAIMAWWSQEHGLPTLRGNAVVAPISVWLLELPKALAPQPTAVQPRTMTTPPSNLPLTDPRNQASTTGMAPAAASVDAMPSPPRDATGAGAPAAPGLNLNLSRKDMTSLSAPGFAAQSPFHGRLPATVEGAIANAAAQSGPWTEERVDLDHIRFRRGNKCITMERPRAAALDPFNEAYARMPWKAGQESDCYQ